LAHRLATKGPNQKMQDEVKKGLKGLRDLLLEFLDSLHISETDKARNFNFGTEIGYIWT